MSIVLLKTKRFITIFFFIFCNYCRINCEEARDIITGIDFEKLTYKVFGKHPEVIGVTYWGLRLSVSNNYLTIGVFSSHDEALDRSRKRILYTPTRSMRPNEDIGEFNKKWGNSLLFVRNNVVIDLACFHDDVEQMCKRIDKILIESSEEVKRGKVVNIPTIMDIRYSGGKWDALTVSNEIGYMSFGGVSGMCTHEGSAIEVYFATRECVMAKPFKCDEGYIKKKYREYVDKVNAVRVMSEEERVKARDEAIAVLNDPRASLEERNSAIIRLFKVGDSSVITNLMIEYGRAKDSIIKQNVIRALGEIGDRSVLSFLVEVLEEPVRGDINDEDRSEDFTYRREAVSVMKKIGDGSVLGVLSKIVNSTNEYPGVKETAEMVMKIIERREKK